MKVCATNCGNKHRFVSWLGEVRNVKQHEILCVCVISHWQLGTYMRGPMNVEVQNMNRLYRLFVIFIVQMFLSPQTKCFCCWHF